MGDRRWLQWVRRAQAIAQNGLTYTEGVFDRERYLELRRISAEMMAALGDADPDAVEGLFARETGYTTPKVDVRGVVFDSGRILLVREREDGLWTLPGGWADSGEPPSQAVEKEVREESGYSVRAVKLLAVLDRDRHDPPPLPWAVYKLFIRCELEGGDPVHGVETDAVGFFGEAEIPPLSLTRVVPSQITHMFEHYRDPEKPTDFD